MPVFDLEDRLLSLFPSLHTLAPEHLALARSYARSAHLDEGAVAYRLGQECPDYLMCLAGGTRTFRTSRSGREILIYKVRAGSTCVFTTQCLISGGTFPAESVAEHPTWFAALPSTAFHILMERSVPFRRFVLDDYAQLLASVVSLVDEVAFASLEERLARRLLIEADEQGFVAKTHQELAHDLGSVREVISRHLGEWERSGWVRTSRGRIEIVKPDALAVYRGS